MAGPNGNYAPGDEVSVNERIAKILVESDSAEYVETPKTEAKVETAMIKPVENAAMPKAAPRKVSPSTQAPKPRTTEPKEKEKSEV